MNITKSACPLVLSLFLGACATTAVETRVTREIEERIADSSIGRHDIVIQEASGTVRLAGEVESEEARRLVEQAALATEGVDDVRNELVVVSYGYGSGTATPITEAVEARLLRDPELSNVRVEVSQSGRDVVLSGWAATPGEADRVALLASDTPGVDRVVNRIRHPQRETDEQLAERVKQVLSQEPGIDMQGVEVTARNGEVIFSGSKSGHREIDHILANALMVSGVKDVSSRMTIAGRPYSTADAFHTPGEEAPPARARYQRGQERDR